MKIRGTKIVALFDILGTKARIKALGIDGVLAAYEKLATFVDEQTGCMVIQAMPTGDGGSCPAAGWLTVEQGYFSDTFLLWTEHDAFRVSAFMQMCIDLFCHGLELGLPLRAGIGVGEAHLDKSKSIYIGPALIAAAEAEGAQKWLGISCGVTFNQKEFTGPFDPKLILAYAKQQHPEKKYKIPWLVLDWPRRWRETRKTDPTAVLNAMNTEPAFSDYYTCASGFVDYSLSRHDWFLKGMEVKI